VSAGQPCVVQGRRMRLCCAIASEIKGSPQQRTKLLGIFRRVRFALAWRSDSLIPIYSANISAAYRFLVAGALLRKRPMKSLLPKQTLQDGLFGW
jgi:hypothetical protein